MNNSVSATHATDITNTTYNTTNTAAHTFDATDIDHLWEEALIHLETEVPEARFKSLFSRMLPLSLESNIYTLGVPNRFNQRLVEKTSLELIANTLRSITHNPQLTISIVVDESLINDDKVTGAGVIPALEPLNPSLVSPSQDKESPSTAPHHTKPKNSLFSETSFNPKYTFDSFVVGDSNAFARDTALAVAEAPALKFNPLFIWGASGLGKTHLLQAIGSYVRQNFPYKKVLYTTAENFVNQYIFLSADIKTRGVKLDQMRRHYRSVDVLLMDDVQFFAQKSSSTEQFFHTFNHLKEQNKQVVLAADQNPSEIHKIDERLTSRFRSGLVVDVQPPSYEIRYAILKNYTGHMKIHFDEDALSYIAEKSTGNIREMEGAVTRVVAWAGLRKLETADLDTVKVAIKDFFPENATRIIFIPTIQKEVCKYYQITHVDLTGTKRKQNIVHARHVAMFLCQELTDSSYPAIAGSFGGKDHTTVMHAVDKIRKMMTKQPEVMAQIEYLTKILRNKAV
jgi:chromosomal replication initiator protein